MLLPVDEVVVKVDGSGPGKQRDYPLGCSHTTRDTSKQTTSSVKQAGLQRVSRRS